MEELENILCGKFYHHQSVQKSVPVGSVLRQIRIFICSTYHDFIKERELIWLRVLPELQQHCTQYGVDVLFFDPYRQSEGDFVFDPLLCEDIRKNFKRLRSHSGGPYFLCLLGDKYGPCPLPVSLKNEEFQHIKQSFFDNGGDVKILEESYRLNENNGSQYDLQANIGGKKVGTETLGKLQIALQTGARIAHSDGLINQVNPKLQNRFFNSFVEQCVEVALEGPKQHHSNCLLVLRKFDDAEEVPNVFLVEKEGALSQKLADLKNTVTQTFSEMKDNLIIFHTQISQGKEKEFGTYLEVFERQLVKSLKKLVDNAYQSGFPLAIGRKSLSYSAVNLLDADPTLRWIYDDATSHYVELLSRRATNFINQSEPIQQIRDLCGIPKTDGNPSEGNPAPDQKTNGPLVATLASKPVFISGEDGSGRTSFLCEIGLLAQDWFKEEVTLIVRFVSQIGFSKFANEMLRSLCVQLCLLHGFQSMFDEYRNDYSIERLAEWLQKCCQEAATKSKKQIVILIDDLDLLKYGHYLGGRDGLKQSCFPWIPAELPRNVLFFATINSRTPKSILPLKRPLGRQKSDVNIVSLTKLNEEELLDLVKSTLNDQYKRSITLDQQAAIQEVLKQSANPFYACILAHEASSWPSWHTIGQGPSALPINALAYLEGKFSQMEAMHGQEICSATFSFIECSNQGLTDTELLDLLSSHSAVMRKYLANRSDAEQLCRMTYITWLKIKNDMNGLFIERRIDNKFVVTWSCPLIRYVVRGRYLGNSQLLKQCHSDMADLFDDAWTYNQPPKRFKFISRLPTPQPLYSIQQSNGITHYNKRRVNSLWFHLLHSGSIDYFEEQSLLNYEYLEAILYSSGLIRLLSIIEDASLQIVNHNLYILYSHCIKPSLVAISLSPSLFVTEMISRLRYTRPRNTDALNRLVDQAMQWIDTNCVMPSLVPLTCWIKPPLCHLAVSFFLNDWPKDSKALLKLTTNYQYVFVCGTHSPDIFMFHVASNTLVKIFKGHSGIITCLQCSANGQFFVSSSMPENSMRIWNILKGECTGILTAHTAKILCLIISRDDRSIISGSADATVKMVDIETGRIIRSLNPQSGAVTALALTTHEEYLITGHTDFTVKLWHMDTARMISKLGSLMAPVTHIALTSNDAFLLVASDDETLHVFSLCSNNELHELRGHEGKVASLTVAADDCQTFVGATDGKIYRYDLHTGKILSIQGCSNVPVTALEMSKDGHFLYSVCGGVVQVWNVEKHLDYRKIDDHGRFITAIAMSRDGKYAASGTAVGYVCLWDLEMCYMLWCTQNELLGRVTCLQIDTEAMVLLSGTRDGFIYAWSMADGALIRKYSCHKANVRRMLVLPDKMRIITHDNEGAIKVWTIRGVPNRNAPKTSNEDHDSDEDDEYDNEVEGVALSAVSDWIFISDNEILLKQADANKELKSWSFGSENAPVNKTKIGHSEPITCMCRSRDARFVVTGSSDQSMKIWDVASGYLTQALVGHTGGIVMCDVDEKFRVVVSVAADNVAMTWDVQTGNNLAKFQCPSRSNVSSLKISYDGYLAFTGYKDGWLHTWFAQTGQRLASFNAYLSINDILLTAECHRIILLLEQCSHFSVLCFHNCPVIRPVTEPKEAPPKTSVSDRGPRPSDPNIGQVVSNEKPDETLADPIPATAEKLNAEFKKARKNSKVFAPIERTRSRASLFESPSTKFTADKPSGQVASGERKVAKDSSANTGDSNANADKKEKSKFCCII